MLEPLVADLFTSFNGMTHEHVVLLIIIISHSVRWISGALNEHYLKFWALNRALNAEKTRDAQSNKYKFYEHYVISPKYQYACATVHSSTKATQDCGKRTSEEHLSQRALRMQAIWSSVKQGENRFLVFTGSDSGLARGTDMDRVICMAGCYHQ